MRAKSIFLLPLLITFFSCASTKFEGKAVMTGRVSDPKGNPVPNYHISAGIGMEAITDSGGIFVFRNTPSGNYHLRGFGNGWRGTDTDFYFHDRKDIVCIQVWPLDSLTDEISAMLDEEKFEEANSLLKKSRRGNEKNPLYECYEDLIRWCETKSDKARKNLISSLGKL